ncbi:DUF4235 domain-containing protein [Actinomycetaceae bacterium L2_0104]
MNIGWKLVSAGAGIVSGFLANKIADGVWKAVVGREHPQEDDYTEPLRDTLVFSLVSAVVGVVVNQLVTRSAAKWYGLDKLGGDLADDLKDSGLAEPAK